jgi:hypothetical protein
MLIDVGRGDRIANAAKHDDADVAARRRGRQPFAGSRALSEMSHFAAEF